MPLNTDDITNLQRGVDAAIDTIIGLTVPRAALLCGPPYDPKHPAVTEFIGFLQALNENRFGLSNMALQRAIIDHPEDVDASALEDEVSCGD